MAIGEKRILHILFADPAFLPPLRRGVRLQSDEGWDICIVGAAVPNTPENKLPEWLEDQVEMLGATWAPAVVRYIGFLVLAIVRMLRQRPHAVYLSNPLSTPVGVLLILHPRVRVFYHEHDAPSSGDDRMVARLVRVCRRFVASRAEACIVPSRGRLGPLPDSQWEKQARLVVNNVPLRAETACRKAEETSQHRLLFMGSLTPVRLPLTVLEAMSRIPEVHLWIVGYETSGGQGYGSEVLEQARRLKIEDRVDFKGFSSKFCDLASLITRCHIGLSLLPLDSTDVNEQTMVGASNKPFQFLACEVPLLVPDAKDWRERFVDRGLARSCVPRRVDSLVQAIRWFVQHPRQAERMGRRGRELVLEEWNYETEFRPVLEVLES